MPYLSQRWREHVTNSGFDGPSIIGADYPWQLLAIMEMLGREDFLMFATDYPHWDFDAPDRALPGVVTAELRAKIMATNALEFYDFARVWTAVEVRRTFARNGRTTATSSSGVSS